MNVTVGKILLLVAVVLFAFAAFGAGGIGSVGLVPLGLAFFASSFLV